MRLAAVCAAVLAVGLFGCAKKDEGQKDEGQKDPGAAVSTAPSGPAPAPKQRVAVQGAAATPASQPASMPAPTGKLPAGHPPTGGQMPAGHPPTGGLPAGHPPTGGQMPAGHPPTGGKAPAGGPGGTLTGTISLDASMQANVKAGSVLFIIVRQDAGEGQRGMLLAAKKVPVTGAAMFPYTYAVGPADVMMQGTHLVGRVRVEARVDQDGDAISKTPGDVIGAMGKANEVGDSKVDFVLNGKI